MDIEALWDKARKETEIIRLRIQELSAVDQTRVPYVFLAESAVNRGDTVVRKGHVVIERPALLLPGLSPQFEGFEFENTLHLDQQSVATFLLVRGIQFPSLRYRHQFSSLDLFEQSLQRAIDHYSDQFARQEDTQTGLVVGPEDAWQFSVLILTAGLVVRQAEGDLRRILEQWRKRSRPS